MADESRIVKDPICGKEVDTLRARAVGIFGGVTYYFCSAECKAQYKDPRKEPRVAVPGPELRPPARAPDAKASKAETKPPTAPATQPKPAEAKLAPPKLAPPKLARPPTEETPLPPPMPPGEEPRARSQPAEELDELPARSRRGWIVTVLVMLIIVGGVLFFTLTRR
jgi:YHS domain-containing protein